MYKLFIPESIPGIPLVPFLAQSPQEGNKLFQTLSPEVYEGLFERVSNIAQADSVMAPHEYGYLSKYPTYFLECQKLAEEAHKLLLISAYQDDPSPINIPGTIIIRPSAYRSSLGQNEILIPAYVEDVGERYGKNPLGKGETPIISFAGKAGFSGILEYTKYLIRNYIVQQGPYKQGLYFRRRALAALKQDSRIILKTILRRHYSAHRNTVEVPPEQAREEYIRSIHDSHFILAPRGDGNYSLRFYETLSLGRIPIVIDTDMPLPLEDQIDYSKCVIRVPWQDTDKIGDYVVRFFESHSEEQFVAAQKQARSLFELHLYMPHFLKILFADILLKQKSV